jgi:elongation factor Ts
MADFTAQDVKKLRDLTGAGMMDAKKALVENDGDPTAAAKWLRERGLGKAAERSDRENTQGAVAVAVDGNAAALVQLKCETDFVAKAPDFVALVNDLAELVAKQGEAAAADKQTQIDDLKITLKENIELGTVVRFEAADGAVIDAYNHIQNGRGVNAVLVEVQGGSKELAHDIAVHIAFAKPGTLSRDEVSAEAIEEERASLLKETQNEGKPEAAWEKIVEGKLGGWFKRVPGGSLLEQPYAKDDKQTVTKVLGSATVTRFAQVVIGG